MKKSNSALKKFIRVLLRDNTKSPDAFDELKYSYRNFRCDGNNNRSPRGEKPLFEEKLTRNPASKAQMQLCRQ